MTNAITELKKFLKGKPGFNMILDKKNEIHFSINHAAPGGISHKSLLYEMGNYKLWILSNGLNKGTKEYKVGDISSSVPNW